MFVILLYFQVHLNCLQTFPYFDSRLLSSRYHQVTLETFQLLGSKITYCQLP